MGTQDPAYWFACQALFGKITKNCETFPKSLPRKGLGRRGAGAAALSPYVATTYDNLLFLENKPILLKKNA